MKTALNDEEPPDNNEIAALVGNGLSIAFSDELQIPALTRAIEKRYDAAAGINTEAARKLAALVRDMPREDAMQDFEALLGPLDEMTENLRSVEGLSDLAPKPAAVREGVVQLRSFMEAVRRLGVGHALEVIDDRAYAAESRTQVVRDFLGAIIEASHGAKIAIANLNYDNLVASTLLRIGVDMCDMARGAWQRPRFEIGDDGVRAEGLRLRYRANFPNKRVELLHLHGSVSWLRSPTGVVYKFAMEEIRGANYWEAWREGRTEWAPEVVLTNQRSKRSLVRHYPFSLAYQEFERRLMTSDRWLIAGYSFRDECVNEMLSRAFRARSSSGRPPRILVISCGSDPTTATVLAALGWDQHAGHAPVKDWFRITRRGIKEAARYRSWSEWSKGDWSQAASPEPSTCYRS